MKRLIASIVLLAPLAAHGQLLKCVSKDGRVEYASQCPPGTAETQTSIRSTREGPSGSAAPGYKQKSPTELEADFRKRQLEGSEARKKEEAKATELAQKREACQSAQTYLRGLQEGQRIVRVDPKTGERVFLDDPDRPAEIAKAQRSVDANCN